MTSLKDLPAKKNIGRFTDAFTTWTSKTIFFTTPQTSKPRPTLNCLTMRSWTALVMYMNQMGVLSRPAGMEICSLHCINRKIEMQNFKFSDFQKAFFQQNDGLASLSAVEYRMDVCRLVDAAKMLIVMVKVTMMKIKSTNLVTTLGKWQRKNMTTVEMRMMARLQSRDCWVARLSRSLSA